LTVFLFNNQLFSVLKYSLKKVNMFTPSSCRNDLILVTVLPYPEKHVLVPCYWYWIQIFVTNLKISNSNPSFTILVTSFVLPDLEFISLWMAWWASLRILYWKPVFFIKFLKLFPVSISLTVDWIHQSFNLKLFILKPIWILHCGGGCSQTKNTVVLV
jgi:hypothetical protein